jgi:hypothetical protein
MIRCRGLFAALIIPSVLNACALPSVVSDYSQKSVAELIDELTQINAQSPGIDSAAVSEGFIADDSPSSFEVGVLGVTPPKVSPQVRELVRRGPVASQS